jgi:hypothetical protein
MIFEKIIVALLMLLVTTLIHALFMVGGAHALEWRLFTLWMFIAICIEVWLWALVYLYNPAIIELPDLQTAFYFSMVTFTSLGYGDVVLTGEWRTLASIQAANGVIIFGWTTALIFWFIQHIYIKESPPGRDKHV